MILSRPNHPLGPWWTALLALTLILGGCGGPKPVEGEGSGIFTPVAPEDLPNITFGNLPTREWRNYLGVAGAGEFTLGDIKADVAVIEFLNVQCKACQRQSPIVSRAYRDVEDEPRLKGRVVFLGVSAGNNAAETEAFIREHKIRFPVLADPNFRSYERVGTPGGLPFTLIVTLHPAGGGDYVAKGHEGMIREKGLLLGEIKSALTARPMDQAARAASLRLGTPKELKLKVTTLYLYKLLKNSAGEIGLTVNGIEPVEAADDDTVYRLVAAGGQVFWAKVSGRVKICNLCHNIYFIVLFSDEGMVLNFTAVSVTKNYNVKWDEQDSLFMRRRLVGRSLLNPTAFNPAVDAVSSATMSSALIVDAVRRLSDTYRALQSRGLVGAKASS